MAQSVSTYAEARDNMRRVVQALNEQDKSANSNSPNLLGIIDTVLQGLNGDLSNEILAALQVMRTSLTGALAAGSVQSVLAPALRDMMLALNKKDSGFETNSLTLRDHMRASSFSMNSSGMTFGTPAAGGGNQGDGGVYRLTVDDEDFPLEATHLELKTLECLQARDQGKRYKETFQYRGTNKAKDNAIVNGSGEELDLTAKNGDDSTPFLNNPHMILSGSVQPTVGVPVTPPLVDSITSWILSATADFEVSVAQTFRASPNLAIAQSLRMKDNANFKQIISVEKRPIFSLVRPVFVQWPVYVEGNCDGALASVFGTDTKTIADITATFTNAQWNLLTHDLDQNRYFKQFRTLAQNDLELKVTLTGRSTGSLFFAAPIVTYMDLVDGHYITVVGGALDFRVDDIFTFTDSQASRGSQKYWLEHRSGLQKSLKNKNIGFSYPSNNAGGETWIDL